jgi:hypothetical protein
MLTAFSGSVTLSAPPVVAFVLTQSPLVAALAASVIVSFFILVFLLVHGEKGRPRVRFRSFEFRVDKFGKDDPGDDRE